MRIGEIKAQALMLMYPNNPIKYDPTDEGVRNALFQLKCNPGLEGPLEGATGAINRAIAEIETMGLSPIKCVDIASSICEKRGDGSLIIKASPDFLSVESLLCHTGGKTYAIGYQLLGDSLITSWTKGVFTLIYRSKIPRITSVTDDAYRLDLPMGLCQLIPYFIKAELFAQEDSEGARESREIFNRGLEKTA